MGQEQKLVAILKSLGQRLYLSDIPSVSLPTIIRVIAVPSLKDLSASIVASVAGLTARSKNLVNGVSENTTDYLRKPAPLPVPSRRGKLKISSNKVKYSGTQQQSLENQRQPFEEHMREVYMSPYDAATRQSGELLSFSGLISDELTAAEVVAKTNDAKKPSLLQKEIKPSTNLVPKTNATRFVTSRASVDGRTRGLVSSLRMARTSLSKLSRTEELAKHLLQYPDAKIEAVRNGAVPLLLNSAMSGDSVLKSQTYLTLSLLGYCFPPDAPGPRILSVDGGGARGIVALEILREIESLTGKAPCDLFDYFIGVSTGALVVAMLAAYNLSAEESIGYYKKICSQLFGGRDTLQGARRLILSHGYYDTEEWEKVLKKEMGEKRMVDLSRNLRSSRFAAISSKMDEPECSPFVFRSYGLPPGFTSHYEGSSKYKVWEAMRASTAAPGFFAEFSADGLIHQDGGILTNNPTAIGIHECKLLWPREKLWAVVSVGTGLFRKKQEEQNKDVAKSLGLSSWRSKITSIIASATDTEGIHSILQDLMPPSTYYRIQPVLSQDFGINISEPELMDVLIKDSRKFVKDNPVLMRQIAEKLTAPRPPLAKAGDWVALQRDCSELSLYNKS